MTPSFFNAASGPEAFKLLLRLTSSRFDHGDRSAAMAKLHSFGVATKMPFANYSPDFRLLIALVADSEQVLAPGR